jgi:hypothetical protein
VIVATPAADDVQVAALDKFCVLPSVYVPVAVYCCFMPLAIEIFAGATAIDTSEAGAAVPVIDTV